ncbi:acidic leucine-rich nuclear phosphoprotein 32 family member A isoform X2 [Episyrphus balteatus]|uniref:acidic leucine-rich nuclear phosphoprotein 32 family member A isoform X2 n=1 Tax=Episyrphus balteatus TaxID=286459 RepID=UPI0024861A7F|nr:acidic leucine-rich nuclear phosphoprotein 32 family member A isoform X2 [Episyrphus balteatus]
MEKRIELERRARRANQITELNLDNCRSTSIVGLTDEYTALESLSLINVGLTTLKGFPKLPNLKRLELSDNRISNGLNYLTTSPKLAYLNLSGNKIKDLEALKPLEAFENLAVLDLFNNEATQIENYREKIFEMLPSLEFLDGFDANDVEAPSEGDDDDEVNGNDSDDGKNAFCINGLEIDLDELDKFEKRVKAKNSSKTNENTQNLPSSNETDDLDEYLKELKLKESSETNNASTTNNCENTVATIDSSTSQQAPPMNFALLLYWFFALLNLVNAAHFSDEMVDDEDDGEDGDDDEEDDSDDEDNGDVSLAEVYNDDLEEDNSEWDEEDGADDDDDDESDEEEADGEAAPAAAAADPSAEQKETETGEEPQSRGKKRKHDG